MRNVKGYAVASDGNMKRIAITYDEIDNTGKVVSPNVKVSRLISDEEVLYANSVIETFAQNVVNGL
jgi:hypothetical protein